MFKLAKGFKLEYRGLKYGGSSLRQSLNNYLEELQEVGEEESKRIAKEIIDEAKELVNIRSGQLANSGKIIDIPTIRKGFKWTIRFSAVNLRDGYNYAFIQHEDPQHFGGDGGKGWHYLQIPFEEHMKLVTERFAEKMGRV